MFAAPKKLGRSPPKWVLICDAVPCLALRSQVFQVKRFSRLKIFPACPSVYPQCIGLTTSPLFVPWPRQYAMNCVWRAKKSTSFMQRIQLTTDLKSTTLAGRSFQAFISLSLLVGFLIRDFFVWVSQIEPAVTWTVCAIRQCTCIYLIVLAMHLSG